jgi:hypothetical protein
LIRAVHQLSDFGLFVGGGALDDFVSLDFDSLDDFDSPDDLDSEPLELADPLLDAPESPDDFSPPDDSPDEPAPGGPPPRCAFLP